MKKLSGIIFLLLASNVFAQTDSIPGKVPPALTFSGYAEIYYLYDFNKPADNIRPGFIYSHNRHNEFMLNLGLIKAAYDNDKIRASLALGAGSYMNANYAAESGTVKNIYEAYAGVRLSKKTALWLDAGIFASHIGFESAVSKDCWTLTRSMAAENSPYFESGIKVSFTSRNSKWMLSALALNGWQRIQRVEGSSLPSFGTQLLYKPNGAVTLNYSTFAGTDKPDSTRLMRYFHNLYGIFSLGKKFGLTAGIDIGMEQRSKGRNNFNTWIAPVLIVRFLPAEKWAVAARAEYYSDKKQVIISTVSPQGFGTAGFSVNVDYSPVTNAVIRLEARTLNSRDRIFTKGNGTTSNNTAITPSIAISF